MFLILKLHFPRFNSDIFVGWVQRMPLPLAMTAVFLYVIICAMGFPQLEISEDSWGYWIKSPQIQILFGGVQATFQNLQQNFQDYSLARVHQVHGDKIVPASGKLEQADAHFGSLEQALCISTADCAPVMIFDSKRNTSAAIHAGWRGVENRIVPKTIELLKSQGSKTSDLQVFIGPHIQKKSFEVSNEVRDSLLKSTGLPDRDIENSVNLFMEKKSEEKSLVDLAQILKVQIESQDVSLENLFCLHIDTFLDVRFHSHRRDKEKAGRQISFITRAR
ncbi:MAG: polyphenol oxidase family protein [Pseudobdellovibrionaceae bacterium]